MNKKNILYTLGVIFTSLAGGICGVTDIRYLIPVLIGEFGMIFIFYSNESK